MRTLRWPLVVLALVAAFLAGRGLSGEQKDSKTPPLRGWTERKGWGWVWGKDDEVGSLNAMTPDTIKSALGQAKTGRVYDLGVPYNRNSFKWPGHSPGEVMTFRSPEGVKRQGDFPAAVDRETNPRRLAWHSCALFMSDNVGTQIDGLGHITMGDDDHWYNGFKEKDWGGNFGIRKCDSVSIPPIITRGVLIDIAGYKGVDALPAHTRVTVQDLEGALTRQGTELRPGDTVMIRTGTLRYWDKDGGDHAKVGEHDSAGIDLDAAKWLVERKGAILIGSDTSGLEWGPPKGENAEFIPVHRYLLIEQGVHIGEFHYLEDLAREKAYEFCYVCTTNKIRGTAAGFALRPLALR